MKRIFSIVVLLMWLSSAKATVINEIDYKLDIDNGVAEVNDILSSAESLTIPDTLEYYGYKFAVKRINGIMSSQVKVLHLPRTLRDTIRYGMLTNQYLEKVYCPPHITKMDSAFMNCRSLKEVKLPDSLRTADYLFYECSNLVRCAMPDNVESMEWTLSCSNLEWVKLPKNLKIMKASSVGSRKLKEIELPNSVESISETALWFPELERINIPTSLNINLTSRKFLMGKYNSMTKLKEVIISPDDKQFVMVDDWLFVNELGCYVLWWRKHCDEALNGSDKSYKLPKFEKIKIDDSFLYKDFGTIEVPKECKEFEYTAGESSKTRFLSNLVVDESEDTLAMRVHIRDKITINSVYLKRPVKPKKEHDYILYYEDIIYDYSQANPNFTLRLGKNVGNISAKTLFEPYYYFHWNPYGFPVVSYAPRIIEIDDEVTEFIPDFSVEFIDYSFFKDEYQYDYYEYKRKNIREVRCYNLVPPECKNLNNLTSIDAKLYVPKGTWPLYVTHPFWGMFADISEMEGSSNIEDVQDVDAVEVERYDVSGRSLVKPTRGLNIVKMSNGKVKKVMVK